MRRAATVALAWLMAIGALPLAARSAEPPAVRPKKIVLIAGPITGHPKHAHEYEKSVILLKHLLDTSPNVRGVVTEAHFRGWPQDPKSLDDADTIVMISDGGDHRLEDHPLYVGDRLAALERQMRRGCGLVMFHWSTFHPTSAHDRITEWVGGYFDYQSGSGPNKWYSAIQTWEGPTQLGAADHPVVRGVRPFRWHEELYYRLRFRDHDRRVTPILLAKPPGEEKSHAVGWAIERADGGRGFGFTGGHFYAHWWLPDFRKLILNAIVWTAKADLPAGGVESRLESPIKALVLTGYHHPGHDWRALTAALVQVLEQDPRVMVDVTENIEDLASDKIDGYELLVMNYNNWDRPGLSDAARENFIRYLKRGGGLTVLHFANGAFTDTLPNKTGDWEEYRTNIVRRVWVHGPGQSGHDAFGPIRVTPTAQEHPITKGLAPLDTVDELYYRQVGTLPIEPLATARSKDTGQDEPMAWAYNYGNGKVFQTVLGHADVSVRKAGALVRRGSVWAANHEPLSFDPPVELTEHYLFRAGSNWTPDESARRAAGPAPPSPAKLKPLTEGRFGRALDARAGGASVAGKAEYRDPPLTIECWARLFGKQGYNVLLAHELKSSATHWELFTQPTTGHLLAYLPGCSPDHVRSSVDLCDGRWHHLALVLEADRARLLVDARQVAEQAMRRTGGKTHPGRLAFGSLVARELGCDGLVDEVRIRRGVHLPGALPDAPLKPEADAVGLWHFDDQDAEGRLPDDSAQANAALLLGSAPPASSSPVDDDHWGEAAIGFRWTERDSVDDRWKLMDSGPFQCATITTPGAPTYKALAIRVGPRSEATICYDTELLRASAGWTGRFLQFHPARFGLITPPAPAGQIAFATPAIPGWSRGGKFDDPRPNQPFGPLPPDWARFGGWHLHGARVVLRYTVGKTAVLESPWAESSGEATLLTRSFEIGPGEEPLSMVVCSSRAPSALIGAARGAELRGDGPRETTLLHIPPRREPLRLKVAIGREGSEHRAAFDALAAASPPAEALAPLAQPGPPRWTAPIVTRGVVSQQRDAYVVDTLTLPLDNPYRALMFVSGHDFFANGDAAVCTAHGDVWRVSGIDDRLAALTWRRMATGLFQPLGLRIVDDRVFVLCRDQLTRLDDQNGDGEADFYENFNNQAQVTSNAHEFATCLETDRAGNFYFLKGESPEPSAHHGTLLRLARDGSKLEVFATGFRNANGLGIGPDDTITVAPQEGNWTPGSAVFVVRQGGFYGFMGSHHRPQPPTDFEPPLCWIPRLQDNSSGGQVWAVGDRWGPLSGQLLHLSYGTCHLLLVLRDGGASRPQGGVITLPLEFDSGVMRGRFRPQDGQLYVSGLKGWTTSAARDGCFQRVRYTGGKVYLPASFHAASNGLVLTFHQGLAREEAEDPGNYALEAWNYRWSAAYGSPELKPSDPHAQGRDPVAVRSATLLPDGRSVFLEIDGLRPVMQMAVGYQLAAADGTPLRSTAYLTLHELGPERVEPGPNARRPRPGDLDPELAAALRPGVLMRLEYEGLPANVTAARLAAIHLPAAAPRPKRVRWTGFLRVARKGTYRFTLAGTGRATLAINGREVLAADGELARAAGDAALHQGHNHVHLQFEPSSPQASEVTLRLSWSAEDFAPEPVPPTAWFHDPRDAELTAAGRQRRGAELFAAERCAACHGLPAGVAGSAEKMPELAADAPSLSGIGGRLQRAWIESWLRNPRAMRGDATMPRLFADDETGRREAANLAAYLATLPAETAGPSPEPTDAQSVERGQVLWEDLGCLACHTRLRPAQPDRHGRTSLHFVAEKFRPGALAAFLARPQAHYAWSRMPDFQLTAAEAGALAAFLRAGVEATTMSPPAADAAQGKELLSTKGCLQCHRVGQEAPPAPLAALKWGALPQRGCLATAAPQRGRAPELALSADDRAALTGLLSGGDAPLARSTPAENSSRLMAALRCAACHHRDDASGPRQELIVEEGEQGLAPEPIPSLTWTGDKLRADWLGAFLAGRHSQRPRPWLKARMPSFAAYASALAEGIAAEHGWPARDAPPPRPDAGLAAVGKRLAQRDGGLDCRQCHAMGAIPSDGDQQTSFAPGVNFAVARQRLRPEFYQRWMLDPLRVDPQTRMPKLTVDGQRTKLTTVMEGDARRQFLALWHFLHTVQ